MRIIGFISSIIFLSGCKTSLDFDVEVNDPNINQLSTFDLLSLTTLDPHGVNKMLNLLLRNLNHGGMMQRLRRLKFWFLFLR